MPESRRPLTDAEVARELEAIQARLAAIAPDTKGREVADELLTIRDQLRRLAEDNEQIRRRLGHGLGLRVDDDAPTDT